MAKAPSRLLVIDASIAVAAGETSKHPTSQNCREFLETMRDICNRMVLTSPIKAEWDKHQSGFARKWRVSMMARRKIELVDVAANHSLEKRITRAGTDKPVTAIITKDRHLIEAALATEKRVASLDDQVRQHLRGLATKLSQVQSICWVNPSSAHEAPIAWLESGAPAEKARTLGYAPPESSK